MMVLEKTNDLDNDSQYTFPGRIYTSLHRTQRYQVALVVVVVVAVVAVSWSL
jgi:hypothetical protein